jgi:tetratricopeptide (TPR) repeat protein
VDFLVAQLAPDGSSPAPSAARRALTFTFAHEYDKAAEAYRAIVATEPSARDAARRLTVAEYNHACALARSGRKQEALVWLRRAVEDGFSPREDIESDPDLVSLRGDPAFAEILSKALACPRP